MYQIVRGFFTNMVYFPMPPFCLWFNPRFYSVFISYERTDDFYFSGHIGTTFIMFLSSLHDEKKK